MRKILAMMLALMLVASMAVTSYAVTPKFQFSAVKIPVIKTVEVKIPGSFWDSWFKEHPIVIDWSNIKLN